MHKTIKAVVFGVLVGVVPCAASAQTFTNMPPPAMRAERPTPPPGPGFTWIPGFWNWTGNQYVWAPGRWERPPAPAQSWNPPAWERQGNRFRFRPGRWGGGQGPGVPTVQPAFPVGVPPAVNMGQAPVGQMWQSSRPPPRPRMERRPPPPQRGWIWIPGFWSWSNNRHAWTPGRWEAPPRPRARWQAPRWVRRGRQWVFMPGRWR